MALVKFHEKAVEAFFKVQSAEGTYTTPGTADVIPALTLEGSITYETGAYEYIGDPLTRDEITYLKDSFADFTLETPIQTLVTLNPLLAVADVPLSVAYRICGGSIGVNNSTGVVTIDNATEENSLASIAYRKTSAQDSVNQKLNKFYDIRGMMDLTLSVQEIPKAKFTFKGNATAPEQNPRVIADYTTQKVRTCASIRPETIVLAQITPYGENFEARSTISGSPTITKSGTTATVNLTAHGLSTGRKVNISGVTGTDGAFYNGEFVITKLTADSFTYTMQGTPSANASGTILVKKDGFAKTFCFNTLTANNFFGFDYTRYVTGCEVGFSKKAVPTDVSITALEGIADIYTASGITFVTSTATATVPGHGFSTGDIIEVSGATGADATYYNGTFVVGATTSTTFDYQMSGTPAGIATTSTAFKVKNNSQIVFNPDAENLNFFAVQLKVGTGTGKYVKASWDKLQLTQVKDGKVADFRGRDVTLRNTGKSYLELS